MRRLLRETLVLTGGFAGFWVVWLIYFVLIALFFESAEAACSGSSPNLTASTWADIGACYRAATNGDTVTVTPNTYNVSKQTTLNGRKAVTIKICGSSMNITDNTPVAGALFDVTEPSNALSNGAGITFDGCGTGTITMGTVHSQPGGSFLVRSGGGKVTVVKGIIFDQFPDSTGVYFLVNRGVVSGNVFNGTVVTANCTNQPSFVKVKPGVGSYSTPPNYGNADTNGDKAVYIENNSIKNALQMLDVDDDGRVVFRFNTAINSQIIHHGDTSPGARSGEYYKNRFVNDRTHLGPPCNVSINHNAWLSFRAGTGRILDNTVPIIENDFQTNGSPFSFLDAKLRRNGGYWACWIGRGSIGNSQYPSPRLVGWGYSAGNMTVGPRIPPVSPVFQDLEPAYIAGNTGSASTDPVIRDYGCGDASTSCDGTNASLCNSRSSSTTFILADREYYKQVSPAEQVSNSNAFNGTTGTGYGTLANRPTTCTKGTAYYATDQGSWNTSTRKRGASVGSDTTDDGVHLHGVLYICTSTNTWMTSTPFTFPHPLIAGGG